MIKIALFMTFNQHFVKYSGVMNFVKECIKDPEVDFKFLYTWNVPECVKKFLDTQDEKLKLPYNYGYIKNHTFDYVLTIDPYFGPHCKGAGYYKWDTPIIYKEYGVSGIDGSTAMYSYQVYKKASIIIADTEDTREKIIDIAQKDPSEVIVGSPTFDEDIPSEDNCIIWAPHCSVSLDWASRKILHGRFSTFMTYCDAFLNVIPQKFSDRTFLYKLHPGIERRIKMGQDEGLIDKNFNYQEWLEGVKKIPNVVIVDSDVSSFDLFKKSSIMLCDSISYIAEYLNTKNPMIVLRDEGSSRYSDYAEQIIKDGYYEAHSVDDIIKLINIYGGEELNDVKLIGRIDHCNDYRPHYPMTNSQWIIKTLKERIGK